MIKFIFLFMAFRIVSNFENPFSTARLLNKFLHHAEDIFAWWGTWGSRSGKMRAAEKACGGGMQKREVIWWWGHSMGPRLSSQGKSGETEPVGLLLSPKRFYQLQQISPNTLVIPDWKWMTAFHVGTFLSKAATKNILLSAGDQVAHLGRWHTWANRPPHPSCAR